LAARAWFRDHARVRVSSRILPALALSALACARNAPVTAPSPFAMPPGAPPAPVLAPGTEALPRPTGADTNPAFAKSEPVRSARNGLIPAGEACLTELNERGIVWQARKEERGVTTPVLVKSTIGNVRFFSDVTPFIADCRLVLALSDLAPELEAQGVTQIRFSGAYVYRTRRSGTLSLHANGLAIDIHDVWFGSERLSVKKDFARGQGRECRPGMPRLNLLACRVREARLFKELLGPDDNADHHDHFHFGVARLPSEVPAEPPVILKQPARKAPEVPKNAPPQLQRKKAPQAKDAEEIAPLDDGLPGASSEEPAAHEEPEHDAAPVLEQQPGSLPEILPESLEH
jgi:hypothetical protein